MVNDSTRTVDAPVGSMYRYGAGVSYQATEHVRTALCNELMWEGTLPLSQSKGLVNTTTSGEFTNTLVNFFSLSLPYAF